MKFSYTRRKEEQEKLNGSTKRITTGIRFEEISNRVRDHHALLQQNKVSKNRSGQLLGGLFLQVRCDAFSPSPNCPHVSSSFLCRQGRFVSLHPVPVLLLSLLCCAVLSVGLLNFHWEANAIRLWIPTDSDFVRDYDRLWSNFPPEIRQHAVIFTAEDNILQGRHLKKVEEEDKQAYRICVSKLSLFRWRWFGSGYSEWKLWTGLSKSFASSGLKRLPELLCTVVTFFYLRVPVNDVSEESLSVLGRRRRRRAEPDGEEDFFDGGDDDIFGDDFDSNFRDFDPSVGEYYPRPYCDIVQGE